MADCERRVSALAVVTPKQQWLRLLLFDDRNLVDPASSHTLVSKIKPCMSKYKHYTVKLRMAHYISYSLFDSHYYLDNRSNSRANTCVKSRLLEGTYLLDTNQPFGFLVNHDN